MKREEIEARTHEILLKQARGEKLTDREETILAYGYYAARSQRMVVRVEPPEDDPNPGR